MSDIKTMLNEKKMEIEGHLVIARSKRDDANDALKALKEANSRVHALEAEYRGVLAAIVALEGGQAPAKAKRVVSEETRQKMRVAQAARRARAQRAEYAEENVNHFDHTPKEEDTFAAE